MSAFLDRVLRSPTMNPALMTAGRQGLTFIGDSGFTGQSPARRRSVKRVLFPKEPAEVRRGESSVAEKAASRRKLTRC